MKISVIHPSRNRPEQAQETQSEWIWRMYDDFYGESEKTWEVEFITSLDTDDNSKYDMIGKVIRNPNKSAIEAINNAAKVATGDIFVVISDDFTCFPAWDKRLIEALEGKSDFLVKTQDGLQKTLITLPIMDRTYYNRFGYIYHPDYLHMHCDEEMTIVGLMLGRVIEVPLLFEHKHYSTGKTKKDAINEKNDNTWVHGQRTLDRHAKDNFGIENPLIKREEIVWK